MKVFESLIIGAGPAGLSAAIYLARFNRFVLVLDKGEGRSSFAQHNDNYLGFPEGIDAKELRKLGKKQAERFGAEFKKDAIIDLFQENDLFYAKGEKKTYAGKTVILATGVTDLFPHYHDWKEYVGKSLFWCITCDGYKTVGKKIAVIGSSNDAACTCLQFLNYTNDITFITNINAGKERISDRWIDHFEEAGIRYVPRCIKDVHGTNGYVQQIVLDDQTRIPVEMIFNEQGCIPSYELAAKLGVAIDKNHYIITDQEQRTDTPCVYAAGDVTARYSHQIVTAAHEGSMAAQAANYDLYAPFQKD